MQDQTNKIEKYLKTDFEKSLFGASLNYIKNRQEDPLRFNSFAYSMRELLRHLLDRFAPKENVKKCDQWFSQDPNAREGDVTRKQRLQYSIFGGLKPHISFR